MADGIGQRARDYIGAGFRRDLENFVSPEGQTPAGYALTRLAVPVVSTGLEGMARALDVPQLGIDYAARGALGLAEGAEKLVTPFEQHEEVSARYAPLRAPFEDTRFYQGVGDVIAESRQEAQRLSAARRQSGEVEEATVVPVDPFAPIAEAVATAGGPVARGADTTQFVQGLPFPELPSDVPQLVSPDYTAADAALEAARPQVLPALDTSEFQAAMQGLAPEAPEAQDLSDASLQGALKAAMQAVASGQDIGQVLFAFGAGGIAAKLDAKKANKEAETKYKAQMRQHGMDMARMNLELRMDERETATRNAMMLNQFQQQNADRLTRRAELESQGVNQQALAQWDMRMQRYQHEMARMQVMQPKYSVMANGMTVMQTTDPVTGATRIDTTPPFVPTGNDRARTQSALVSRMLGLDPKAMAQTQKRFSINPADPNFARIARLERAMNDGSIVDILGVDVFQALSEQAQERAAEMQGVVAPADNADMKEQYVIREASNFLTAVPEREALLYQNLLYSSSPTNVVRQ